MILTSKDGQSINFEIPEKYKRLAINVSGGADSSLLLYLTIKYLEAKGRHDTEINILTCANDFKGRWNAKVATEIVNKIKKLTNTSLINLHYIYYRDRQEEKYFHEVESKLFADGRIDLILSGITCNPREDFFVTDKYDNQIDLRIDALPVRDFESQDDQLYYIGDEGNNFYTPFKLVDKRWIADMYDKFAITDSVFPSTRSCEGFARVTNNFSEPCGECWWCLERKWAFGKF